MPNFSQTLIDRLKAYYASRNVELSDETANEYLASMADLYGVMAEWVAPAALAAEPLAPQVLVTPVERCGMQHHDRHD